MTLFHEKSVSNVLPQWSCLQCTYYVQIKMHLWQHIRYNLMLLVKGSIGIFIHPRNALQSIILKSNILDQIIIGITDFQISKLYGTQFFIYWKNEKHTFVCYVVHVVLGFITFCTCGHTQALPISIKILNRLVPCLLPLDNSLHIKR